MGVRFGAGRLRIELRPGPYSRSEAAVAWRDGWQCPVPERPAEEGRSEILFAVQRVCCERFCASLAQAGYYVLALRKIII